MKTPASQPGPGEIQGPSRGRAQPGQRRQRVRANRQGCSRCVAALGRRHLPDLSAEGRWCAAPGYWRESAPAARAGVGASPTLGRGLSRQLDCWNL